MRYSYQREIIKKIVCSTKSHPTADWIYSEAKKKIHNISLGTVYRNLKTLEEIGSIKLIHDQNKVKYDGNTKDHHHLKCTVCGILIDVEMNSDFRVKWPLGQLGALPDDAEQNMRLRFIEKDMEVMEAHVDTLRIRSIKQEELHNPPHPFLPAVGTPEKHEPGAVR